MTLTISRRIKQTPFTEILKSNGVKNYTVYNRTLLATVFASLIEDYKHLKSSVQIWDVSCQTQIEITGNDSFSLIQSITSRDISSISTSRCMYIPIVDINGKIINDPVLIKINNNSYRLSCSDSDLYLWILGLISGRSLEVKIIKKNIFTLAVQGPKSKDLMLKVFGENINNLKFFGVDKFKLFQEYFLISRTGFSKQGGFEIYIEEEKNCIPLWNILFESGKAFDVRAGCPNLIERIEAGLLSYGNDMTESNSPLECGLDRFCSFTDKINYFGKESLLTEKGRGVLKVIRSISIEASSLPLCTEPWPIMLNNKEVGKITSSAYSPDFKTNVSLGMVDSDYLSNDINLKVEILSDLYNIQLHQQPFI